MDKFLLRLMFQIMQKGRKKGSAPFFYKKLNHCAQIVDWYTSKFLVLTAKTNIILKNYGEGRFRVTLQMSPITPVS